MQVSAAVGTGSRIASPAVLQAVTVMSLTGLMTGGARSLTVTVLVATALSPYWSSAIHSTACVPSWKLPQGRWPVWQLEAGSLLPAFGVTVTLTRLGSGSH